MGDFLQLVIQKYETRDQLVQMGIWRGELYKMDNESDLKIDKITRGWIWKTLVLQTIETNGVSVKNVELINVPMVTTHVNETHSHHHKRVNSLEIPIKKLQQGIRKLTPRETYMHPLRGNHNKHHNRVHTGSSLSTLFGQYAGKSDDESDIEKSDERNDSMTLEETLEIIDLDLSRLIIDPIFMDPHIHAQMRRIMFSYLVYSSKQKDSRQLNQDLSQYKFYYKQGFHELLGMLFLQLYDDKENRDELSQMRNILYVYERLMNQVEPVFYNEREIINWEMTIFAPMLQNCSIKLYNLFYPRDSSGTFVNKHSNMIWLIRWTRLLFMRELSKENCLMIWDHLLTFTFPIKTFIASVIVVIILLLNDILLNVEDEDDLIEIMLHIKDQRVIIDIDIIKVCQMAGNLSEMLHLENYNDMKLMASKILKQREIDPHRQRMEDRLRQRVQQTISRGSGK